MTVHVKVAANGRMVLPAEVRRRLGLHDGGTVSVQETPDGLVLRTADQAIRRVQEELRRYAPADGRSVVDDFIAERRREAERE